jgi:Uma2 family endonuclease
VAQTKPAGTWTYEDLFSLPDDGRRYEIINGELFEMPLPTMEHATVVANVITVVIPLVRQLGGRWLTAPLDVFFQGADPVQPDILAILPGGSARLVERGVEGPPDLIVEVVIPTSHVHDALTKHALYALGGVREYWTVDPASRTMELFTLDRDAYHRESVLSGSDAPHSLLLGALPFPVDDLFANLDERAG